MTRIPENMLYDRTQQAITRTRSEMLKNQEMASTGKRINRASDDPVGTMRANRLKTELGRQDKVNSNMEWVSGLLLVTDTALGELTEVLSRARELAVQMSSATNQHESSRIATAKEIDQLLERAVQVGNTRYGDRYVFGGYQTNRSPFDANGDYYGDDGKIELEMDSGKRVQINMPGTAPFYGITEIPDSSRPIRQDEMQDDQPSINAQLRSPASVLAENRGLDVEDKDDMSSPEFKKIERQAGVNVLGVLKNFSEALRSGKIEEVQSTLDNFERGLEQVISARSTIGARQNSVDRALDTLATQQVNNQTLLSDTQDADAIKVFSELSRQEHVLGATMKANEKLITPSLLDFLK